MKEVWPAQFINFFAKKSRGSGLKNQEIANEEIASWK